MDLRRRVATVAVVLVSACCTPLLAADLASQRSPQAWTVDEAVRQACRNRHDVYLQYVAMQLARNENRADEIAKLLDEGRGSGGRSEVIVPGRSGDAPSLTGFFTGALAVHENLQLQAMRITKPSAEAKDSPVAVNSLAGVAAAAHPWEKLLATQAAAGKRPEVSPLALCVPADQYFVLFRSVGKLLEVADVGDLWGQHLLAGVTAPAAGQPIVERLTAQLVLPTGGAARPLFDSAVGEVALTGSDLYIREGTDVTVLLALKQPEPFRLYSEAALAAIRQSRPDVARTTAAHHGIPYTHVATPDRTIQVFAADPRPGLHVRSNSHVGLCRVLDAIAGKTPDGKPATRLGETAEFKYIRTILPQGAKEEDGLVYLSDPFLRKMVAAQVRLTEHRRMLCYSHLRMIGYAAALYRTQFGRAAQSLEQLATDRCAPGRFGEAALRCPCGGEYRLSADGTAGVCSHHGAAGMLVPCCEIPLEQVTEPEANAYRTFVEGYSDFWKEFFDPIAIRIQMAPERYRVETVVLPLIDRSIYSGLRSVLGGPPQSLDAVKPLPQTVASLIVGLNKEALLKNKEYHAAKEQLNKELAAESQKLAPAEAESVQRLIADLVPLIEQGLGNEVGFHLRDFTPPVSIDVMRVLGPLFGSVDAADGTVLLAVPSLGMIGPVLAPMYVSVAVRDAQVVDGFLERLDRVMFGLVPTLQSPEQGLDYYTTAPDREGRKFRCIGGWYGPLRLRVYFARIGQSLIIGRREFLEELCAVQATSVAGKPEGDGPPAHAMIRIATDEAGAFRKANALGWAEWHRLACLRNLGSLSAVRRSAAATGKPPTVAEVCRLADSLHASHLFCPDGGSYQFASGGKEIVCTCHGSPAAPRQVESSGPAQDKGLNATAQLLFLDDGLRAIVTIRK